MAAAAACNSGAGGAARSRHEVQMSKGCWVVRSATCAVCRGSAPCRNVGKGPSAPLPRPPVALPPSLIPEAPTMGIRVAMAEFAV